MNPPTSAALGVEAGNLKTNVLRHREGLTRSPGGAERVGHSLRLANPNLRAAHVRGTIRRMVTLVQHIKERVFPHDQASSRASFERFERWRAALGLRPSTIHIETPTIGREFPIDVLLEHAANDD